MKTAGMFKCLSVTEGNVALGPEVQVSVKRNLHYIYICSSGMNKTRSIIL